LSGIFISYRRSDNPDATGRIYDRLVAGFGKARVFKDVDSIPLGQDFRGHLSGIVGECGVVLAIIGPSWLDVRNKDAQRRLDDPDDFVRIELEAALARDIPVVPVLVGHAPIPGASELPASLAPMAFRQSIEVRPDPDFHNDATRLVAALRGILDPTAAAAEQAAAAITSPSAATAARSPRRLGWIVAAVLLGITAALLATPAIRYLRLVPPPETRLDIVTPATDDPTSFALSPDGRQIIFVAPGEGGISRLWLRPLSATSAQPLTGTEDARLPFWSPDSRSVGFFTNSELQRLDLGGGAPRTLAAAGYGMGGAWNADGVILFSPALGAPLQRIPATGGSAVAATKLAAKQVAQGVPVFLPDGRHFLFSVAGSSPDTTGIYLATLGTTDVQRLTAAESSSAYLPSGWLLWVQPGGNLVAQRLDLKRQRLTGDPVTIAGGVAVEASDAFSVSATGLVAYRTGADGGGMRLAPRMGGGNVRRQMTWFDRTGKPREVLGDPDQTIGYPSLSPDGQRAAVQRTVQGNTDIWLLDATRTSRLTFDPAVDIYPVWSPDGHSVVFSSFRNGFSDLYRKAVDGSGTDALLVTSSQIKIPTDWSRDGRYLLYFSIDPQTKADLWVQPMTGDQKPWLFLKSPFDEKYGQFSPDGRFVAYQSDESGRYEIYLRPFTPPGKAANPTGGQWQISTDGGIQPRWSPDGRELYYLDPHGRMMAVPIMLPVAPGKPELLFPTRILGGGVEAQQGFQYAVARDGRFLIDTVVEDNKSTAPIRLIQNWQPPGK
jgi:Tol biopolymer transport system component